MSSLNKQSEFQSVLMKTVNDFSFSSKGHMCVQHTRTHQDLTTSEHELRQLQGPSLRVLWLFNFFCTLANGSASVYRIHQVEVKNQIHTNIQQPRILIFFFLLVLPSFIYNSGKKTSIKMRLRLFLTDVHCWPDPKSIDVNEKTPWGFGLGSNCWKN